MPKTENQEAKRRANEPDARQTSAGEAPRSSIPVLLRWFLSKRVRHASAMRRHVWKILSHQRDVLPAQAIEAVQAAITGCQRAVAEGADNDTLEREMEHLEKAANKWLKPYPNPAWRENVEVLLVALAVAMGIRTFFLQPFKIPTGSMQPTLYGVTSQNLIDTPYAKISTGLSRIREWFAGVSYVHQVAKEDGLLQTVKPAFRILIFNIFQTLVQAGKTYTIWFPPDYGAPPAGTLEARAGLQPGVQPFVHGQDIIKLRVSAGDHLFVDRLTYNFRPPKRGETVVFETKGIENLPPDQFYIKRLVGLGGETLSLREDYMVTNVPSYGTIPVGHLLVNGEPLSAASPHFENVYSFPSARRGSKAMQYEEGCYYGHALLGLLKEGATFQVQPNHLFVLGDNTMNSLDSRYWGDFPANQVIGKSFFVYWPITERFGWGNR